MRRAVDLSRPDGPSIPEQDEPSIADGLSDTGCQEAVLATPAYLERHYWWAYVHPASVSFFERQWLVNLILLGNFRRLCEAAIDSLGTEIFGRTLQVACVYGDFTERLLGRLAPDASLDVIDVLPIQLENLRRKVIDSHQLTLYRANAADNHLADGYYDQVVVFFLLHEMPFDIRKRTIAEVMRVTKPGGRIVFVDYHAPVRVNPVRWLMRPVLKYLEPFALDLWKSDITEWVPPETPEYSTTKHTYFGGLYQRLVIYRHS